MATKLIGGLTTATSAASGDYIPFQIAASGLTRKITKANLIGAVFTGGGTIATGGNTLTINGTSVINGSLVGNMTGSGTVATGGFTLTVPATGTAALLATTQIFTGKKTLYGATFADIATLERLHTVDTIGATGRFMATKATNMADGFGAGQAFYIQDDAGVENPIATIGAKRAGADNTGNIVFATYAAGVQTEQMELDNTGFLKVLGGVKPSSTSDALNAYLTTTSWTPALKFGGATTGITYTTQIGEYLRVGSMVYLYFNILLSSKGSATGAATITGVPFTIGAFPNFPLRWAGMTATLVNAYVLGNASTLNLRGITAASTTLDTNLTDASFANTTQISMSGWYRV